MKRCSRIQRLDVVYFVVLLLIGIWFFFFLGKGGYILEKDSNVFLEGQKSILSFGYIVYPMFAKLCKVIFGERYIEAIFIIQSFMAISTSFVVTEYIRKVFSLTRKLGVLVFTLSFGPYTYTLPQYVANHGIMTEGISFPLFNLWMICAIELYRNRKVRWYILIIVLSILMAITRPQLLVFLVISIILVLDTLFMNRKVVERKAYSSKRLLIAISGGIILCAVGIVVFCVTVKNSYFPQLTDAVAGRVLCTVQNDDGDLYTGEMRALFEIVFKDIDENGDREVYFRKDYKRWEDICVSTNNNAKLIGKFISANRDMLNVSYHEYSTNEIIGEFIYPLLIKHWDGYLLMTFELLLQSLVVSIFIHPDRVYLLCCFVAALMYLFCIVLLSILKKRKLWEFIVPMRIVLVVITILCVLVNVVFIGIQRYVVYPFGWFYIATVVMLYGYYTMIRTHKMKEELI